MLKITKVLICFFIAAVCCCEELAAQLPSCPNGHIIYLTTGNSIYSFDADQPTVPGVNPVLNSISLPAGSYGLAVCRNFYAASPAVTFFTMNNSFLYYYNGSSWVNTNHNIGTGYNLGAGGAYLFNYSISGDIYRYDGTGNATLLINIGTQSRVADLSVDCSGNFYVLNNSLPQSMDKYNSSGVLMNSYNIVGAPVGGGGAGLAIFGNDIFYDDGAQFMRGTFNGNTVNFTAGNLPLSNLNDYANCPGIATPTQVMVTVCSNQLPYTWNGNSYNTAGTYTVTLPGILCDSLVTLNLSIGAVTGSPEFINICSAQIPYNWNGNSYSSTGTYTATLTNSLGCDSIATLNLIIGASVSGPPQNISVCPSLLPYTWNGNSYSSPGTYTATFINSAGCDSIATLNLSIGASVTGSPQNISICPSLLPYTWNGNSYSAAGTYTVTLPSGSGCDSIATLNLSIGNAVTGLPQNVSVCPALLPYNWNGNNYSQAGTYSITLTGSNGCDSIATLNLSIGSAVSGMPQNVSVCPTLLPYNWNGNNYSVAGTYTITLTGSSGCDSIAILDLIVGSSVTGPPQNVSTCTNQLPYNWNGNNYSTAGSYSVTLTGSGGCDSIAILNLVINSTMASIIDTVICPETLPYHWNGNQYNAAGIYTGLFNAANGCDSVVTLNLSLYPPVHAFAGNDDTADYNSAYQLHASGGNYFAWSPPQLLNDVHLSNPVATITATTSFYLLVKDMNGCTGKDTVLIKIIEDPAILVPTAFSPGNDVLNNIFRPRFRGISHLNYFNIFNRFGELIFQTNDLSGGWDGRYRGLPQNMATYVWMLQAVDLKGKIWNKHGSVVLVR